MSLAIVYSRALSGIHATDVRVEVHVSGGLPSLSIVGMPETAVKESKDRVRAAILNARFEFPPRRITINLAPADLPKEGGRFDLPIAIGVLAATGQIPSDVLDRYELIGELALGGELRGVKGALPTGLAVRDAQRTLILPEDDSQEAGLVDGLNVLPASSLLAVCQHLMGHTPLSPYQRDDTALTLPDYYPNLLDVKGQYRAKRALEIAAAGGHNLLFVGPPGTGKSMLASRLPGILPPMDEQQALESAAVMSVSQQAFDAEQWMMRPFRAPHHTASGVALVGGGSYPRPGEISLAHGGVLFLDELTEFNRHVLDVLREPMESGKICISRATRQAAFPAQFQLIAAMNPCPCGNHGSESLTCRCTPDVIRRYLGKVSGPFLDRIDLHVEVPPVTHALLSQPDPGAESSEIVQARVVTAASLQQARARKANAELSGREVDQFCALSTQDNGLLSQAMNRLGFSARGYHRILKVARTIADLEQSEKIMTPHLTEALGYRALERFFSTANY